MIFKVQLRTHNFLLSFIKIRIALEDFNNHSQIEVIDSKNILDVNLFQDL
jgi:hypothetical protein